MIANLHSEIEYIAYEEHCRKTEQPNYSIFKYTFIRYIREHGIAFDWWEIQWYQPILYN